MADILETVIVELIGDDSKLKQSLNRAERAAQTAASRIEGAFSRAAGPSTALAGAVGALSGALSALGLRAVGMAGQMEQARIGLTTMLGTAEAADKHLRQLYDFAAKTPFEINGLIDADRRLMAMGFSAGEVIPTLTAIGDAVAAVGGNAQLLDRVTLALGQMRAKGKVSGEEMRQLAEAGIPAWEMLANAIGTSIPDAMKMAEQGAVDATTGIEAILSGMEQRFSGSMEAQSRTILGMWSNVKDNLTRSMIALGETISDALDVRGVLQTALGALERFRAWLERGGLIERWQEYKNTITIVAGAIAGALTPAVIALGTALWGALAPLTPFLAAGAALAGTFVLLGGTMDDVKVALKTLGTLFSGLWDIFSGLASGMLSTIGALDDAWRRYVDGLGRSFALLGDAVQATLAGDFERAKQLVDTAALAAKTAWAGSMREIAEANSDATRRISEGARKVADVVTGRVGAAYAEARAKAKEATEAAATGFGVRVPAAATKTGQAIQTNITKPLKQATTAAKQLSDYLEAASGTLYGRQPQAAGLGRGGAIVAPGGATPPTAGGARIDYALADFDVAAREAGQAAEELTQAQREATRQLAETYRSLRLSMAQAGVNRLGLTPEQARQYNVIGGTGSSAYVGSGGGLGRGGAVVAPREGPGIAGGWSSYQLADFDTAAREAGRAAEERRKREEAAAETMQRFTGAIGGVLEQLNPFAAILEAINPIGTVIQGMLERLGPVLEPITAIFAEMGKTLGGILAPALKLLTPIVQWFGDVLGAVARFVAGIWNAIARGLNAVLGWLGVSIPTVDLAGGTEAAGSGTPKETTKPTWTGWSDATNAVAAIGIQAAPTPVVATPGWVHTFGGHVERFGAYVTRLVEEGIRVQVNGAAATAGAGGVWNRAVAGELG